MNIIQVTVFRILIAIICIYILLEYNLRIASFQYSHILLFKQVSKSFILLVFIIYTLLKLPLGKIDSIITLSLIWGCYVFVFNVFKSITYFDLLTCLYVSFYWPLSIVFFYYFFKKYRAKYLNEILFFMIVLMGILIYQFSFEYVFVNRLRFGNENQLNLAYFLLLIVPWLFLIKKRTLRIILLITALIPIIFSLKRTAILAMSTAVLFGYGTELFEKGNKERIKKILTILIVIVLCIFVVEKINTSTKGRLIKRFESIVEDRGTKRLDIYEDVIHLLGDNSDIEWFVGHGHNTVKDFMFQGLSAHNDWLETLFDHGIIGLCIYFLFHLFLIMRCINLAKVNSIYAPVLSSSYVIFLIMSMTSHLIMYPYVFVIMTILWGSILGLTSRYNQKFCIKYYLNVKRNPSKTMASRITYSV